MPSPSTSDLPKPKSWDEFESIVFDIYSRRWNDPTMHRHGRPGQPQQGVDIYGQPARIGGQYAGLQCKRFEDGMLTKRHIDAEIAKAETFTPPLATFAIATTESRNARLQKTVRDINEDRRARGLFSVDIVFWEDMCDALVHPDNHDLLKKHYPTFIQLFGHITAAANLDTARTAIIATIEKATGGRVDSHFVIASVDDLIRRISAAVLLEPPLDEQRTSDLTSMLVGLFISSLDRNAFDEAKDLVGGIMDALVAAPSFTNAHANLLHQIGFACWNVGESGASLPRIPPIPGLLEDVQTIFIVRLRRLIHYLLESGPASAVEELCWVLAYLAYETADAGGGAFLVGRIADITHDTSQAYVSADALHELACGLGRLRQMTVAPDMDIHQWIDDLVDWLADRLKRPRRAGG